MYKIQIRQGETIYFTSLSKNETDIKNLLDSFEKAVKESYENQLTSMTITNVAGLPCIIPKNILMNSIISIIKE
jgi:hypothetical protein